MRRSVLVVVLLLAASGCVRGRPGPVSPVVLPDVTGHTALLIDHVGRYELTTEPIRDIGSLPGPQLKISWSLSCHATWRVEAVDEVPVPETDLVRLQALVVVDSLRQPVLAGYDLTWTRMGSGVVGLAGEGPAPFDPAAC